MLVAEQIALEVGAEIRPLLAKVRKQDPSLFDQARRAANSVVLNIAGGQGSGGGNARLRYGTAIGSAPELSAALRLAVVWGYVAEAAVQAPEARLDRVRKLLWGLR
ncbi:MAG: four helix bundle protein [Myxococcales bacterium]|jgi:four helix bundle protein